MTDALSGDSPAGTGRCHPAGPQPLADEAAAARRRRSCSSGVLVALCARLVRVSRPTSSARRRSSASASRSSSRLRRAAGRSGWSGRCGRRVSDLQVALYVEEHEPSLQAAILSAVDIGATAAPSGQPTCRRSSSTSWSSRPSRRRRTIRRRPRRSAARRCSAHASRSARIAAAGRAAARRRARSSSARARRRCSSLSRSAEAASPYAIKVTPGDVSVPKGSDQSVVGRSSPGSGRTTSR